MANSRCETVTECSRQIEDSLKLQVRYTGNEDGVLSLG